MSKLPSFRRVSSTDASGGDLENPPDTPPFPPGAYIELTERMPHLKNPKLLSDMRLAVGEVVQARSTLRALGPRPDHESVDKARLRMSDIGAYSSKSEALREEYEIYKAVIALEEMHDAYEGLLSDAERRLEKIYAATLAGDEGGDLGEGEVDEEVAAILKDVEAGKVFEKIDLSEKRLRTFPEALGRVKLLVVLNLSKNQLQALPDSISGLENLEELNLSSNLLESLPDSIGLLFKLKILDVSRNKLSALPDSISQCRLLTELDASFNSLNYLPTNIGFELKNLKRLSINLNKLRSLPTSIGEMRSLRILEAHFNSLHTIPLTIGRLTNLEILNLSSNFTDLSELPETITDLINLKELDLSNNQIHSLPNTFGHLFNLTKLNLDQNPLVIPPKEVLAQGVDAVKAYMSRRLSDLLREEEEKMMHDANQDESKIGLLNQNTSWFSNVVSKIWGDAGKSIDDAYLNQQL